MDPAGTWWFYRSSALRIFRTFWGLFGWANVPLLGHTPYRWLAIPTLLGLFGLGLAAFRWRRKMPWDIVFVFGLFLLGTWGFALMRSSIYTAIYKAYLPVAALRPTWDHRHHAGFEFRLAFLFFLAAC